MKESKSLVLSNITKEFKAHTGEEVFRAVDDISVTINAGEFVTLLGPSGCGKTTTLRMLAGFEDPTDGDLFLGGERINDQPASKRDTAMVFQSYALFPHYSVYDNVAYGLKIKKMEASLVKEKVIDIINMVGLSGLENRSPGQLSGGQQQRVALARALVMEPDLLLFDEPLSNLDAKLRVYMRNEIKKIQQRLGLTSVYVTHDQTEAMGLSDRVIIMNKGKIEQIGTPEEVYQQPATQFVADFIGTANFADGTVQKVEDGSALVGMLGGAAKITLKTNQQVKVGEQVKVVIRPEAVTVGEVGEYSGLVEQSTFMGNVQEYSITVDNQVLFVEVSNPTGKKKYNVADQVKLKFQDESLHLIKID